MTTQNLDSKFFQCKPIPITLTMEDTGEVYAMVVFMSPVKVKDIAILNKIVYLQEQNPDDLQASMMLVSVMMSTLDVESDVVPAEATDKLVSYFIEYNFPQENKEEEEASDAPKKKHENINDGLLECFDFLISVGHKYSDILEYPCPLFNDFVERAAERLDLKKKTIDPALAFRKLGLPVRTRAEQNKINNDNKTNKES